MVRLTADLILESPAFINAIKERELDLRGNKIPAIENLGVAQDQFDIIDLSDNEIMKLENFPIMSRLRAVFLSNNRLCKIDEGLQKSLPRLDTLVLSGNSVDNLADIDPLSSVSTLRSLSLIDNKITTQPHYRLYVIHKLPSLRWLDFRRVKQKEREESAKMFGGAKGSALKDTIAKTKTFVPGQVMAEKHNANGLSGEEVRVIEEAIRKATGLDEIKRLQHALELGTMPKDLMGVMTGTHKPDDDMEE